MSSPDPFHPTRVAHASLKANNLPLQLAEYNAHKVHVDEYKLDMFHHLVELETRTRPNLLLIQQQPEINLRMRPLLLDFLMDVIHKLNLSKSTFPLTVNIIDRYCLVCIVNKQHYQLLGLTALWIACKSLDSKFRVPLLADLCKYCCHCYDKKLFLEMEKHVLKLLGWCVDVPTFDALVDIYIHTLAPSAFLAGSRNPNKVCNELKVLALYVCELVLFYPNIHFNYTVPRVALVAVVLASMILERTSADDTPAVLAYVAAQTGLVLLGADEFNAAFALLIKVLKCPPPSLKTKYFSDLLRFLHLMKMLVAFTWKHLHVETPRPTPHATGVTTPTLYPPTPVLSTISPKHERPRARAALLLEHVKTLPLPNLLPAEQKSFFKRTHEPDMPEPVKRAKSCKAVFYIH